MVQKHYFEHPFAFSDLPEIIFLMSDGGPLTYGRCLLVIEILGRNDNRLDLSNKIHRYILCQKLELKEDELEPFINWITETNLFFKNENVISSKIVDETIEKIMAKSEKYRQNASEGWEKRKKQSDTIANKETQSDAIAMQKNAIANDCNATESNEMQSDAIAMQSQCKPMPLDKIRKDKIRKEEIRKDNNKECANAHLSTSVDTNDRPTEPHSAKFNQVVEEFNNVLGDCLPKVTRHSDARRTRIKAILSKFSIDDLKRAFQIVKDNEFLSGRSGKWKGCSFDWITQQTNLIKILEGNYNRQSQYNHEHKPNPGNFYDQRQRMMLDSIREEEEKERLEAENEKVRNEKNIVHNIDDQPASDTSE